MHNYASLVLFIDKVRPGDELEISLSKGKDELVLSADRYRSYAIHGDFTDELKTLNLAMKLANTISAFSQSLKLRPGLRLELVSVNMNTLMGVWSNDQFTEILKSGRMLTPSDISPNWLGLAGLTFRVISG
ncbi:MAG: hypothetical protein UT53_C0009G0020 [Candidatus Yanofskybacteria bacterium GW2011_GWD2_39_48]|uniref:Uncharacterized protein n=1 Tax=Candidatus Yanofskybacteria bacterium GW2011_GWD2_39_48 TaxID=1619031 RepID=A0A0G0PEY4_9BACT|nr:MAG: hypothetical protein UT53_C0009G0020 [Candidatus Yanofskybacteria bacterium GW2011_GWD2_39_48]